MNSVVTLTAALACGVVFSASAESVLKLETPSSMLLFEQKDVYGLSRRLMQNFVPPIRLGEKDYDSAVFEFFAE